MAKLNTLLIALSMTISQIATGAAWRRRMYVNHAAQNLHFIMHHDPTKQGLNGPNPDFNRPEYRAVRSLAYISMGGESPDRDTMTVYRALRITFDAIMGMSGKEREFCMDNLDRIAEIYDATHPYEFSMVNSITNMLWEYDAAIMAAEAAANAPIMKPVPAPVFLPPMKDEPTTEDLLRQQITLLKEMNELLRN